MIETIHNGFDGRSLRRLSIEKKRRIWFLVNDLRPIDIAREVGVDRSMMTLWLDCRRTSSKISRHLREKYNMPDSLLDYAA